MTDLTLQDRDNYTQLRSAAFALKSAMESLDDLPQNKLIKALVNTLVPDELPVSLTTIEELEEQVDRFKGYLAVQKFLLASINATDSQRATISQATENLSNQVTQIKSSLQDIEDADLSTLDDLNAPCVDALFFSLLPSPERAWTEKLLDGRLPALTNEQLQKLIAAWGTAISAFVEDARKKNEPAGKVAPGQAETVAHFFCIHEGLEALYDKLSSLTV